MEIKLKTCENCLAEVMDDGIVILRDASKTQLCLSCYEASSDDIKELA